jgi:hypothetical protein
MYLISSFFLKKFNTDKFLFYFNYYYNFNFFNILNNNINIFLISRILFSSFFFVFYFTKIYNYYFLSNLFLNRWMIYSKFIFYINLNNFYQKYNSKNYFSKYICYNNIYHNTFLYLNHHSSELSIFSNILIPVSIFLEKSSKYSNLEGFIIQTRRLNRKFIHVKYDWIFWFDLFLLNYYINTNLIIFNNNFNFLLFFLNFKNYYFNFFFIFSTFFLNNNLFSKLNIYLLINKYLIFEFPYMNFLNFFQKNIFFFFLIHDFFYFNYICIGSYFKYSFFINNIINFNSKYLLNGYKTYIFNNYSNILYNFKYHSFYI